MPRLPAQPAVTRFRAMPVVLTLGCVLLLWAVFPPWARSQSLPPLPAGEAAASGSPHISSETAPAQAAPPQAPCQCPYHFWIVSTRCCPQEFQSACGCNLQYFHVDHEDRTTRVSRAHLLQSLSEGVPLCVVTHGSFVSWEAMRNESTRTFRWLRRASNRPLHVVFFTWPSDDVRTPFAHLNVAVLGHRSGLNGFYLAQFLSGLPVQQPLCLLGHSHGARVTVASLHLLSGGTVEGYRLGFDPGQGRRIRTVLAAPAIDHNWLNPGERYGCALRATEALVTLVNRRDFALSFYPLRKPFSHRALARTGFTRRDQKELGYWASRVAELDVTAFVGAGHIWPHYYSHPEIAAALVPYVYFDESAWYARN